MLLQNRKYQSLKKKFKKKNNKKKKKKKEIKENILRHLLGERFWKKGQNIRKDQNY